MSVTTNIPDITSMLFSLSELCVAGAFVACIYTLAECAIVLAFPDEEAHRHAAQPAVTILKPLHGEEPDLPDRLTAFYQQDYGGSVQVLCGTRDHAAPAAAAVRAMQGDLPDKVLDLAIDARSHGFNRKISNLINMLPRARHDTLVLSDSDIAVGPGYLRALTTLLASPRVGAVTCLYYGIGGDGLWSRLSALAINSQFLPQAVTAVSLGLANPCCGATIALRRSMLDRIGGFNALADVLADDHAIGVAVRSAGYDLVTAPFLVGHHCFDKSLRQLVLQQIRAARTIRSIAPAGYAGTIVTHPFPLALLGSLSGSASAAILAIAVLVARITLCRCVERRFGLPRQNYWLVPLQDMIAFGVYIASFFGATVHWQGAEYRVEDGNLIEDKT